LDRDTNGPQENEDYNVEEENPSAEVQDSVGNFNWMMCGICGRPMKNGRNGTFNMVIHRCSHYNDEELRAAQLRGEKGAICIRRPSLSAMKARTRSCRPNARQNNQEFPCGTGGRKFRRYCHLMKPMKTLSNRELQAQASSSAAAAIPQERLNGQTQTAPPGQARIQLAHSDGTIVTLPREALNTLRIPM